MTRLLFNVACVLGMAAAGAACGGGGSAVSATDAGRGSDAPVHEDVLEQEASVDVRAPGQRTPLSAACDAVDGTRCLLPWPSNTFTVVDSTTQTGLRVNVGQQGVGMTDSPVSLNRADGFSRVSPILTGFAANLDPTTLGDMTTGALAVIVEQPGPTFGQLVPMRFDMVTNGDTTQSMIVGYTRVPLAPNTDYAVVVSDRIREVGGGALSPDREAQVALGLATPTTASEKALFAYDAPARQAMAAAGLDVHHALRVWDFTTRSLEDATADLYAMRASEIAAFDGTTSVGIEIDSVTPSSTGTVELVVLGQITGVPNYLTAAGSLSRSGSGRVTPLGVHSIPFRIAMPTGTGDYHIVMYGHGLGGDYTDNSFDAEITGGGAAKIGIQFMGWTSETILNTFAAFTQPLIETDVSTAGLLQSVADAMVVQHGLGTLIGDVLSDMTIGGVTNPMYGRRPDVSLPVWAGGSLGGTMGYVYSAAEPTITAAVINVPGAAWTHFIPYSNLWGALKAFLDGNFPTDLDKFLTLATTQIDWDPVDGATWYDAVGEHHPILLEQESIGDPVLPNIGDEMVAASSHADQVGVVLNPIVTCPDVTTATNHSGMTQFKVPSNVTGDPYNIHGFAAGTTPAGVAAQQQIQAFIVSVWAGSPVIAIPPECMSNTPANSCDFTNAN